MKDFLLLLGLLLLLLLVGGLEQPHVIEPSTAAAAAQACIFASSKNVKEMVGLVVCKIEDPSQPFWWNTSLPAQKKTVALKFQIVDNKDIFLFVFPKSAKKVLPQQISKSEKFDPLHKGN
jgi:hypothetical protein